MNSALLRSWMDKEGVRPEELATKLGVSFSTVRAMMAGKKPYRTTLTVLSQLMGVSEEDLSNAPKQGPTASRKAAVG